VRLSAALGGRRRFQSMPGRRRARDSPIAPRAACTRSSNTPAGSSAESCATNSPRKALARSAGVNRSTRVSAAV
jgi:hypothetical protein